MSWKTFLQAHWEAIAASDMLTVEIWVGRSLVRYHILFTIELGTRRFNIMGIAPEPEGPRRGLLPAGRIVDRHARSECPDRPGAHV